MNWQPLSVRTGKRDPDGPFEGMPDHIGPHLFAHIETFLKGRSDDKLEEYLAAQLRISVNPRYPISDIIGWAKSDDDNALDLIDLLAATDAMNMQRIRDLLEVGGSVWTVADRRLVRRVEEVAQQSYDSIAVLSDPAATEIRSAWGYAYGRNPDPSDAWDHSIKALECALKPVITPNNTKATLGHVVGVLQSSPSQHPMILQDNGSKTPAVDGPVALGQILRLVWPNPDRHGENGTSRRPTLEEAQAVVHLAVAVIQWVNIGVFDRSAP